MILTITMNPAIDKVYAIDDFAVNHVFRPKNMTATAGGKGLNVARVAHILGESVTATGLAGGSTGEFIQNQIRQSGIVSKFVSITGETRICINIMDEKNRTSTEVLEPGPEVSPKEYQTFLEQYEKMLDDCDVVTASGSLPKGVPVDSYRDIVRIAKSKGKKVILDTSGEYFKEGIKEKPFMVKPNADEIEQIMDVKISSMKDYVSALLNLKSMGIDFPVITLGRDGCIAAFSDGIYHFSSPDIKVLNTVGSGDSFVAGCAVGLSRKENPIDIIKLGMACGTANTQFFETGMVSIELVEKFLKEIDVQKIS